MNGFQKDRWIAGIIISIIIAAICVVELIQYRSHLEYAHDYFGVQLGILLRENEWQGYDSKDADWIIVRPSKWSSVDTWRAQVVFADEPELQYYFQFKDEQVYLLEVVGNKKPNKTFPTMDAY